MDKQKKDKKFLSDIAMDIQTVLEDIRVLQEENMLTKDNIKTIIDFYNIKFELLTEKLFEIDRNNIDLTLDADVVFDILLGKINRELSQRSVQQDEIFLVNLGRQFGHTTMMCQLLNMFKTREDVDIKAFVANRHCVEYVKREFLHDVQGITLVRDDFMKGKRTTKDTILVFDNYSYIEPERVRFIIREYGSSIAKDKKLVVVGLG